LLAGFVTLFVAFLVGEEPPAGTSAVLTLGVVVAAAGIGNAGASFIGNRLGRRSPLRVATGMLLVATLAALATTLAYGLPSLVLLGLVTGAFGQLSRLCLGALVQHETPEDVHSRVFALTETRLQAAWVVGGGVGIVLPLIPWLGFGFVTLAMVGTFVATVCAQRGSASPVATPTPSSGGERAE
jgi:MFS family permease